MPFEKKILVSMIGAVLAATAHADDQAAALPDVHVQATSDQQSTDYAAGVTTVGAKTPTAVRDVPQTVTVVNQALMQAQGATSLADALRNVPGITLGGAEGGQIGNNISLRGFSTRTDIYLDGFRDYGQYYRDTFDLEQIEVLQGPSSMLFGRGSTGGVINQVTKQAVLSGFDQVSTTVGSDGRSRATLDSDHPLSADSAIRINVVGQDLQTTRDVMSNKDYGVAPTLRFGIGTPTEVTLSALLQHNDDMPDYGFPSLNGRPVDESHSTFYGLTDDHTTQDVTMLSARIQHKFNATFTLSNDIQFNDYETDARETAPHTLGTVNTAGTFSALPTPVFTQLPTSQLYVELQSHDRDITDTSLDNQTELVGHFATGFIKHDLILGAELGRDTYKNQGYTRTGDGLPSGYVDVVSLDDPAYESSPADVVTKLGNLAHSSADSLGAYANDTLTLSEQWKAVTGVRWDRFDASLTNTTTNPISADQTNYFTSVREGVIYQPSDEQSYYVSYGTSFDPSLETLTVTNGTQNLPPETTRSYELGSKWDLFNERLSLTSAVYNEEMYNSRTEIGTTGVYTLDGDIDVKGVELGGAGYLTKQWQIFTGYMYMDAKVVDASDGTQGNVPANTPRNTVTLWTTYNINSVWEIGGGANYMSSRWASNGDLVSVPGYTRWDATVAYHQPKYDVRLNLLNLTNKQYFDGLIQSDGGRASPGIGRTALLTLVYHF